MVRAAITTMLVLAYLPGCTIPGADSPKGFCNQNNCGPEDVHLQVVLEMPAYELDAEISCTACRNGSCVGPVVGSGQVTSDGLSCSATPTTGFCGVTMEPVSGVCFEVVLLPPSFPLVDGDVYSVRIGGEQSGRTYLQLDHIVAQFTRAHPTDGCYHPEAVTCSHMYVDLTGTIDAGLPPSN